MKVCLFGNGFFNGILFCNLNGLMYLVVNISSVALLSLVVKLLIFVPHFKLLVGSVTFAN
jgi:hypothetical protein